MSKVRALQVLNQHVGSLLVMRPRTTEFDLPDDEVPAAVAAGLVESLEDPKPVRRKPKLETK